MPAVRNWIKQYVKKKKLWIENDLNIGFIKCTDDYYQKWWEVCLEKHQNMADVMVIWDNGNFKRITEVLRA